MSETSTTAMLVGTRDMLAAQADAVTATVPRDEVEGALTSEPPAELTLEVWRPKEGGKVEKHFVDVAWKREDLESVLADLDADAITFSFDRVALERAIDGAEVEGHGLREAAVVLSIAAAAAVSGASAASAEPGGAVVSQASQVQVGGHDEATSAERGIESGTVAASHDEATFAARGIEPGYVPASHDEATLVTRGVTQEPIAITDTGSGFDLPSVDPAVTAGIVGGLAGAALIIAAAGFAIRRREPGTA
jgi:hypothetical protein